MSGTRILFVADFDRRSATAHFYGVNFVLYAGLVRAGYHVVAFSDRDTARERSLFGRKKLGRRSMNRALVDTARNVAPHLVLFGHADLTTADTFAALRNAVPGIKLAQYTVDALFRTSTMAAFARRAAHMDRSFITSAGPDALRNIGAPAGTLAYMPYPVDPALTVRNVSEIPRDALDFDGIFLGSGIQTRNRQIDELKRRLSPDFRFFAGGGIAQSARLQGIEFLKTLTCAAMSPSLPLDDTEPVDHLYTSDRITQILGNGILSFCHETAGLDALYEDGIVTYSTIADVAEQMSTLAKDDTTRQHIAKRGYTIATTRTATDRVARYLIDQTLGDGPREDYGWPSKLI